MIEISGLTKAYGETRVLDGIDLTVSDAQIAAVVGPSGAGKSTLARDDPNLSGQLAPVSAE